MLRVTDDVLELRRWAQERRGRPCRRVDGRIALCFGDRIDVTLVGWDEFEPTFCVGRCVFGYDDAPNCRNHLIGSRDEVRAWVGSLDPRLHGAAEGSP